MHAKTTCGTSSVCGYTDVGQNECPLWMTFGARIHDGLSMNDASSRNDLIHYPFNPLCGQQVRKYYELEDALSAVDYLKSGDNFKMNLFSSKTKIQNYIISNTKSSPVRKLFTNFVSCIAGIIWSVWHVQLEHGYTPIPPSVCLLFVLVKKRMVCT